MWIEEGGEEEKGKEWRKKDHGELVEVKAGVQGRGDPTVSVSPPPHDAEYGIETTFIVTVVDN